MSEFSFHLIEEREFRQRFLPAVQGNEDIVREMLDAAGAEGPVWTALHKLFDETRVEWLKAVEAGDGEAVQRTLFAGFARLIAHIRPAYCVQGFGLSLINPTTFPEIGQRIRSPGQLLLDAEGRPLEGVSETIAQRVPPRCLPGRSGGVFVPAAEVRDFLAAVRGSLPRLADELPRQSLPAEAGLTVLLSALVEAKLQGRAVLEASDALLDDQHLPKDHKLSFEAPEDLPPAVVREVGKVLGKEPEPEPEPKPEPKPERPVLEYSPQGRFEVGQRLRHKNFGEGVVIEILDSRRLKASFKGEEKILIQGLNDSQSERMGLSPSSEGLDPV